MPLTDTKIRAIKPPARPMKVFDGGGLHLLVSTSGTKAWRFAYRYNGKQKTLGFGQYPAVGLADARSRRDKAKGLLAAGTDPSAKRKLDKINARAGLNTFRAVTGAGRYVFPSVRSVLRPLSDNTLNAALRRLG